MIVIRSNSKPFVELELSGNRVELEAIRHEILNLKSATGRLVVDASPEIDPAPYERCLSRLIVARTTGATKVSVSSDDCLLVEGSTENLNCFASFLAFSADAKHADHHHVEYFDGNPAISRQSLPLVISLE